MSFHNSRALQARSRRACGEELLAGDADPAPGDPDRSDRPRPARHRPDRHRQDGGVRAAVARPARRQPQHSQARPDPHAGACPDARARRADRRHAPSAYGRFMQLSVGVDLRRRPQRQERARRVARARRARRHPGPPARPRSTSARSALRELEILVLDEADQMLDLGFIHALKRIVAWSRPSARPCSSRRPCRGRSRNWPTAI